MAAPHGGQEVRDGAEKVTLDPILTGKKSIHCYFLGQWTGSLFILRYNDDDRFHEAVRIPSDNRYRLFPLLTRGIIHDLKTPLQYLRTNLSYLKEKIRECSDDPDLEDALDQSLIGTEKINDLIHAILDFQKGSRNKMEEFSLRKVLDNVLLLTRSNWKKSVDIISDYPSEDFNFNGDKFLIERAIFNLIVNGCQALESRGETPKGKLEIGASPVEGGFEIIVADNGPGLSPRESERIFLSGYTTKSDGDGLGLPMVKQIVEEIHGGRLTLSSVPGEGTTFTMFLPEHP